VDELEIQLDTMIDIAPCDSMFCMQIRGYKARAAQRGEIAEKVGAEHWK
jgi:hypothetical protein